MAVTAPAKTASAHASAIGDVAHLPRRALLPAGVIVLAGTLVGFVILVLIRHLARFAIVFSSGGLASPT
ncbi:MAG: hypothetical protein DMG28_06155 [Acidobacteria bacterium]|nr:MAG: hypothetical protein DMG28_06155 [Acidobacteriota bacterium]